MFRILRSTLLLLFIIGCANTQPTSKISAPQAFDMNAQCVTGSVRQGYLTPTTNGDFPCASATQNCVNGVWQGPQIFNSCSYFTKSGLVNTVYT